MILLKLECTFTKDSHKPLKKVIAHLRKDVLNVKGFDCNLDRLPLLASLRIYLCWAYDQSKRIKKNDAE